MWLSMNSSTPCSTTIQNNSGTGSERSYPSIRNTAGGYENMDSNSCRERNQKSCAEQESIKICYLSIGDRELDRARRFLVSNAILCHFVSLRPVCVSGTDRDRYHNKCASRTSFHEGGQHTATGRLRRRRRQILLCRIHRKFCSFRLVWSRSW